MEIENINDELAKLQAELANPTPTKSISTERESGMSLHAELIKALERVLEDPDDARRFVSMYYPFVRKRLRNNDGLDTIISEVVAYCDARGELNKLQTHIDAYPTTKA
jgi:hypothetical protein